MKYEKPRVVAIGLALASIKGGYKNLGFLWDSLLKITIGAYQSDE
jgi:hypothetical protein